jgi:hypothetical protein
LQATLRDSFHSALPAVRASPWHPACVRSPSHGQIVAEPIVQLMLDAGIERIYGVVGDALDSLTDAIRRSPKLR